MLCARWEERLRCAQWAWLCLRALGTRPLVYDCAQVHEMNCVMRALGQEAEVRSVGMVVSAGTGDTPPSI
jgi:hypothetical protein